MAAAAAAAAATAAVLLFPQCPVRSNPRITSPTLLLRPRPFPTSLKLNSTSFLCRRVFPLPPHRRRSIITCAAAKGPSDYYSTLNVRRNASLQEIKASYRKLARQYHPDMNKRPDAEEKFKEISAAYEL